MSELSPAVLRRMEMTPTLKDCERVIERAVFAYAAAGDALRTIRDKKLYKEHFSTFEDYCRERWGWRKSQVYRQIEAAEVHNILVERTESSPIGEVQVPQSEGVARELAPLRKKPAQLEKAWVRVIETHGPDATAKQVREVLADVLPPKAKSVPCPGCGQNVKPAEFESGTTVSEAKELGVCKSCGRPAKAPYILDTERKRQLAAKAGERFWAIMVQLTTFDGICNSEKKSAGDLLHLDKVIAIADADQLREQLGELDRGIARARQLRAELADRLGVGR